MSENDGKKGTSAEPREEVSGTAGLERTVGTTATSTGTVERTGVAPAMPDTGNLDHAHTDGGDQRLGTTAGLGTNTGAGGLNTIPSNQ
jgi:hypothetical protein